VSATISVSGFPQVTKSSTFSRSEIVGLLCSDRHVLADLNDYYGKVSGKTLFEPRRGRLQRLGGVGAAESRVSLSPFTAPGTMIG
jgi:hypothetical protein